MEKLSIKYSSHACVFEFEIFVLMLDDLIATVSQAGNIGVLRGAERFDQSRGYKFSTYVQYWIRKSISTLVTRHARGIRIPVRLCTFMMILFAVSQYLYYNEMREEIYTHHSVHSACSALGAR